MVQVCGGAIPEDGDVVAAEKLGFGVQGLGDVAEEVDYEFEGLFFGGGGGGGV